MALDSLLFQKGDVASIASSYDQATIIYNRVKHVIDAHGWLQKRFKRTTETRGITKSDGSGSYKVSPAKEGALQGKPFVRVILDEGHLAKRGIWTAATKGTSAMDDAMVLMITTAGDQTSETLLDLYKSADKAIAGDPQLERFGAFIWEAPANAPIDDPDAIRAANPAVACDRVPIERVLSDIATQPEHEVRRYTLNQFISGVSSQWLPNNLFRMAASTGITTLTNAVLAVDISHNWEHGVIAAANTNGELQETELVASFVQPSEQRLFDEIVTLYKRFAIRAVTLDSINLSNLAKRLKAAGIPVWSLWGREVSAACSSTFALFSSGKVRHANDPLLVAQMGNAVTKYSGETWLISRKESRGDVDAVLATIMALYVSTRSQNAPIGVF
jgi:phage terminase large subunit-like protein